MFEEFNNQERTFEVNGKIYNSEAEYDQMVEKRDKIGPALDEYLNFLVVTSGHPEWLNEEVNKSMFEAAEKKLEEFGVPLNHGESGDFNGYFESLPDELKGFIRVGTKDYMDSMAKSMVKENNKEPNSQL